MKFSVIIPAYNSERFIIRSVSSVLKQTFDDYEVIVVNDGSTDDTLEKVKGINDSRVRVIDKQNGGVSSARNVGIKASTGDFVCFLDSDDEYYSNHLSILFSAIVNNCDKTIFATRNATKLLSGKINAPNCDDSIYISYDTVHDVLFGKVSVWTGCMCIKKEAFDKFGLFDENSKYGEDRDMWERIYVHSPLVFINTITVKRNRDGSEATRRYNRKWSDIDHSKRMDDYLKDPSISQTIKNSLVVSNEWRKLSLARTHIVLGKKRDGLKIFKTIDKKKIPFKRKLSTIVSFFVPQFFLRYLLKRKNNGYYSD